ncbi:magnesium transporter [Agrocybe pediades]|nr:magnesium transporter [Agrocybe pediades]
MPRENSLSDSEGRSLTPEPEEDGFALSPASADYSHVPAPPPAPSTPKSPAFRLPTSPVHQGDNLTRVKTKESRRSLHSKHNKPGINSPLLEPTPEWATLAPIDRFRAAVRKVMAMHRGTSMLGNIGGIGAEPGIDPRRPAVDAVYNYIKQECEIEIMDYSAVRNTTRKMDNAEFVKFMDLDSPDPPPRDPWVKVRWINIGGISWDVIKALSIKYELHPLALEDVFHGHARNRSKADYYTRHLFLRVLCHELLPDGHIPTDIYAGHSYTDGPRTSSPEPMNSFPEEEDDDLKNTDEMGKFDTGRQSTLVQRRNTKRSLLPINRDDVKGSFTTGTASPAGTGLSKLLSREKAAQEVKMERQQDELITAALKEGARVNVNVSPMFFFLFRNGTVISIRPTPNLNFTAPIKLRLRSRDTVLRKSADPSLLLHAMLDLIVDKAIEVVDKYHANIHKFEREILLRSDVSTVRDLHILSGDLILHKRTLDPIKTLIYSLRRYDVDRCAALIDSSDPANADVKVVGFMSHKAKIYLADVYDHMDYILTSLDMFAGIAENLINYTFNTASYEMNEVMRRLTIATIIFLPLTLLTGYFGMNFTPMWSVNNNSDLLFWKIALPIMVLVVPLALWGDLKKFWAYMQKKSATKKVIASNL